MALSAMSSFWQLNNKSTVNSAPPLTISGGTYSQYVYNLYSILVVTGGTTTITSNLAMPFNFGCLVVSSGGDSVANGGSSGSGGDIVCRTYALNLSTLAVGGTASLIINPTSGGTSIQGLSNNIGVNQGASDGTATIGGYRGPSYTGNVIYGGPGQAGFNFSIYPLADINLISGYIAGGGGIQNGAGGAGGGGGGSALGAGGDGVVTFGNGYTLGANGATANLVVGGDGGANTGGGGGRTTKQSALGGSGVILIYYLT